jgi:hypothetical protein
MLSVILKSYRACVRAIEFENPRALTAHVRGAGKKPRHRRRGFLEPTDLSPSGMSEFPRIDWFQIS